MHTPVLLKETIEVLNPKEGEFFIDGTLGSGGHAKAIVEKIGNTGTFLGVDRDKRAIDRARDDLLAASGGAKLIFSVGSYASILDIMSRYQLSRADGLLLDLGFSSDQVDEAEEGGGRGFSFRYDEPLLMTYDEGETPAYAVIKDLGEDELAKLIEDFGEERYAKPIAKKIKEAQKQKPIVTTKQLTEAICAAVPSGYENGRIHPATRTFMALRIFVNKELEHLESVLGLLPKILNSGARVAIISFHSLEDRIVKNFFRSHSLSALTDKYSGELPKPTSEKYLKVLTKKAVRATEKEVSENPRSRSAKLRAAVIL